MREKGSEGETERGRQQVGNERVKGVGGGGDSWEGESGIE